MHHYHTGFFAALFLDKPRSFLSKSSLNGRTGCQLIKGETGDISVFRFFWFEPIWFYNPSSSLSRDKMEADYFLDLLITLEEDIHMKFSRLKTATEIPKNNNPVTLIGSVVCSSALDFNHVPSFVEA